MYKIGFISKEHINEVWQDVEPFVRHVVDMHDADLTIDDIHVGLLEGHYWLVAVTNESKLVGVFVCSLEILKQVKTFFITICCGIDLANIKDEIIVFMKEGAKGVGASVIEWRGRHAFIKAFRGVAKVKHVAMTIDVE